MKKVKRWRYYCDFCKKVGGSAFHMKNHESACTSNPNRVCKLCVLADLEQIPMTDLKKIIIPFQEKHEDLCIFHDWDKQKKIEMAALEAIREKTECPACILAALKQTGFFVEEFDFKAESKDLYDDCVKANQSNYDDGEPYYA